MVECTQLGFAFLSLHRLLTVDTGSHCFPADFCWRCICGNGGIVFISVFFVLLSLT